MARCAKFFIPLFFCVMAAVLVLIAWSWIYPFGRRAALLPNLWGGLSAYALDNEGWFPDSKANAYEALAKLYPTYCTASELAGVSANVNNVRAVLEQHMSLSARSTSWVYFPGFRRDDPENLAILWERVPGYYWNGRRNFFGGRPVLFVNGTISNVPAAAWEGFLRQQEELRSSTRNARTRRGIRQ